MTFTAVMLSGPVAHALTLDHRIAQAERTAADAGLAFQETTHTGSSTSVPGGEGRPDCPTEVRLHRVMAQIY